MDPPQGHEFEGPRDDLRGSDEGGGRDGRKRRGAGYFEQSRQVSCH